MSVTATKLKGPWFAGCGIKKATYRLLLDSAHASGGEPIDFTSDFDYIDGIAILGNDTAADNYIGKFDFVLPAAGTAISSSNVLLTTCWSADGTDGEAFVENTGDVSSVGQLRIEVTGR